MNQLKKLTVSLISFSLITASVATFASQNNGSQEYRDYKYSRGESNNRSSSRHDRRQRYCSSEVAREEENRELAETALTALYIDADEETVDQYFAEDYIQHNPFGLNGIDFVKDIFIYNKPEGYKAEADFMMVDGDYVLGHSRFTGFTAFYDGPIIAVDVYRIEDGKIVEHWDVIQEEVTPDQTVSGNAMFPIPQSSEFVPEWKERKNARMVTKAITRLIDGDETVLDKYFDENYINHNPTATNGLDSLRGFSSGDLPEGFEFEIGFVIADGPYVAMQTRGSGIGPVPVITFDIFRVENNLIVEHWDVIQDEVPAENTASGNPMFPIMSR